MSDQNELEKLELARLEVYKQDVESALAWRDELEKLELARLEVYKQDVESALAWRAISIEHMKRNTASLESIDETLTMLLKLKRYGVQE